jgi:hypothetical protein
MLAPQLAFESNNIYRVLDQLATTRRKRGRDALLIQASLSARRALAQLSREPLVTRTADYIAETLARYELNGLAVMEEIRVDRETILWFVRAECDLLRANGFDQRLIDRIQADMLEVLSSPLTDLPTSMEEQVGQLLTRIDSQLDELYKAAGRSDIYRDIAAVLGVLGGCAVVTVDTAAAAATTGMLSPLLAASLPVGADVFSRAISEVTEG